MNGIMYRLNTLLTTIVGLFLLACVVLRAFCPTLILPQLDIPCMVLLSLIALVADHYLSAGAKRCYICIPVFSAITFGLLPFAACFVSGAKAAELALMGAAVFTLMTWLFSSIQDRLSTGPAAKAAPVMSAFGLYLAVQGLMGMIL